MAEPSLDTVQLHRCVARWQAGDRGAADELLGPAGRRLEQLAHRMLRGFPNVRRWADTADVLQGAQLRLLSALRQVCPESTRAFFALAAALVRRELLDLARHFRGRNRAEGPTDGAAEALREAARPEPSAAELELWCRFHEAAEALPVEEREVVGLVYYHGWTQAQIAELFGVAERTIRRRWVAACAKLHAALGGQLPAAED